MLSRNYPDFTDNLEWNSVYNFSDAVLNYQLPVNRLPDRQVIVNGSGLLVIGVSSQTAKPSWKFGGIVKQVLPFAPSTVSVFRPTTISKTVKLNLGAGTLFEMEKIYSTYTLLFQFPRWLLDVYVEVWRYDGRDQSVFEAMKNGVA